MSDFFKCWRRKAGCVLLVMAAVLAAGWVRSLSVWDQVLFSHGDRSYSVMSYRGGVAWWSLRNPRQQRLSFTSQAYGAISRYKMSFVELTQKASSDGRRCWSVFYWQPVIPLTLLSAYLILLPGKRAAKRPQTNEVT